MLGPVVLVACTLAPSPQPTEVPPVPTTAVREVALPDARGFDPEAEQQMREAHARVTTLAGAPTVDPQSLGQAYGELGMILLSYDRSEASQALTNAAALAPADRRWPYYLGHFYQREGDFASAARFFERALALEPQDVPTLVRLAQVYRSAGQAPAETTRLVDQAIALDPACAPCQYLLGQLAADQGDDAAAIEHFETTLRIQPQASTVHASLAAAYRRLGNFEQVEAHTARSGQTWVTIADPLDARLSALRRGSKGALTQGEQALRSGDRQAAIERYEQAVAASPNDATAHMVLGLALAEAGDLPGGIAALGRARDLAPDDAGVLGALGSVLVRAGEQAEAEAAFSQAVAVDPRNAEVRFAYADLLLGASRCAEAVPHYAAGLEVQPSRLIAYAQQALCLTRLGRDAEALAVIEAAHAGFPDNRDLATALARLLASAPDETVRDGARALALAEKQAADSRAVDSLDTLAMALAEVGRFDDAIRIQGEAIALAREQGRDAWLSFLEDNLARYQRREPNRTPWPEISQAPD